MEDYDYYPHKPDLVEKKSNKGVSKSIFSLLLFIMAFSIIGIEDFTFILFLVIVILIHELGHFVMMKVFKYKDVQMMFVPFMGAFVKGTPRAKNQTHSMLVLLGGPLPGILIGIVLLFLNKTYQLEWLGELAFLFLFLNSLNLIPLDPLDGGQLLKLLINKKQERFQLVFSFISSIIMILAGWYFQEWIIVIFGFLMGLRVRAIQKNYQIHKELDDQDVNYVTSYQALSNKDFSFIKQSVLNFTPALRTYIEQVSDESVDPIIATQVNNVLIVPVKKNATFFFKIMVILSWISAFTAPFIAAYFLKIFS